MKPLSLKNRFQYLHFLFTFRVQYFNYVTPNDINVTTFVMSYNKMSFDVVVHDSNSPWSLIQHFNIIHPCWNRELQACILFTV
jgi:hypothetical protein